jgi:glycosyltransferase involved in cell wall biosynthesis
LTPKPAGDAWHAEIAAVALAIPTAGIRHAGGEYVRRHHRALGMPTLLAAEPTQWNVTAVAETDPPWVHGWTPPPLHGVSRLLWGAAARATKKLPLAPWPYFVWSVLRNKAFRAAARQAQILEIQWTQYYLLARLLRVPQTVRRIGVTHDVVSQSTQRRVDRWPAWARWTVGRVLVRATKRAERWLTDSFDDVVVFSRKDADLLRSIGVSTKIHVIPPGLETEQMPKAVAARRPAERTVLTVANFGRDENVEGALWFLDRVWPRVLAEVPDATLLLVGADPQERLVRRTDTEPSVTLTGYVDNPDPYYESATVFVVPVLRGAGVKFKTVTAMLWGVPIVATGCGAEGVGPVEHFVAVTEDPEPFGRAVVDVLRGRRGSTQGSLDYARETFGAAPFSATLREVYQAAPADEVLG